MSGVANVASQQCSAPRALATAETAARSVSVSVGFAGVSLKTSLVLGRHAAATASASRKSTKLNSTPNLPKSSRAARFVPP